MVVETSGEDTYKVDFTSLHRCSENMATSRFVDHRTLTGSRRNALVSIGSFLEESSLESLQECTRIVWGARLRMGDANHMKRISITVYRLLEDSVHSESPSTWYEYSKLWTRFSSSIICPPYMLPSER